MGDVNAVEVHLSCTRAAEARDLVRAALQSWNLHGLVNVTELLADELVTNVVQHVGSSMTLRVEALPRAIRVEVSDASREPPRVQHPDAFAIGGRGMLLVDHLSTRWGTDIEPGGKTVWFELDVDIAAAKIHSVRSRGRSAQRIVK